MPDDATDYKSPCEAVTIFSTLVNTQTDTDPHTDSILTSLYEKLSQLSYNVNVTERSGPDGRGSSYVEDAELRYIELVDAEDRLSRTVTTPSHIHVVRRISVCVT